MSNLIKRLREEQGRLQRMLDTKDINKARRRTLGFRLKMICQSREALEAKDAQIERLTADLNESERQTRAQLSRVMQRDEEIEWLKGLPGMDIDERCALDGCKRQEIERLRSERDHYRDQYIMRYGAENAKRQAETDCAHLSLDMRGYCFACGEDVLCLPEGWQNLL